MDSCDFLAGDETQDVDVVDELVLELAPGGADVLWARDLVVVVLAHHQRHGPHGTGGDLVASRSVSAVEPAVEPDLHGDVGRFDDLDRAVGVGELHGEWLLAEGGPSGGDAAGDELDVGRRRGGDQDRVDPCDQLVGGRSNVGTVGGGNLGRHHRCCVVHDESFDVRMPHEVLGVDPTDATGADQADLHRPPALPSHAGGTFQTSP